MLSIIKPLVPVFTAALLCKAAPITEQQTLVSALEHRYDVRIINLESRADSLNPEKEKSQWLPKLSVTTELSAIPFDSTSATHEGSNLPYLSGSSSSLESNNAIEVSQHLPGGGTVGGSLRFEKAINPEQIDSTTRTTAVQVQFSQPLLRNAWRSDPVAYAITLARLDNEKFTLEQQRRLLSFSSDVRTRFWNLFEAQTLVTLYRQEAAYAQEQLAIERTRVELGMAPPIDTLSAKLSWINATARLHDAQSENIRLKEELIFYSGSSDTGITIDSAIVITTPSLPPPDTIIALAERFDPQLRIFTVAAKRLALIQRQTRNSLLPDITLKGAWKRSADENSSTRTDYFVNNSVISLIIAYDLPIRSRSLTLQQNAIASEITTLERTKYREELRLRVGELKRSWERERRGIAIATSAEEIARQTLAAARNGFSVGTVDRLSLVKAENDYRSSRIELLRKQLLMKQLEIVFDEITGATLTTCGVQLQ
jgi:outer membrane protein TolC